LKLGASKRSRQRAAVVTEQIRKLFDLTQFDIDVGDDNNRLIAAVDGETYGYNELGSGLGHFSVALVNLAARDGVPSWILVDEPENGLHPTLQLAFLTILASFATEGVVFATHSYGLARRIGDQVYVVRRDTRSRTSTIRPHEAVKSLAEFLGELGFSGYRDLGFDKIMLVEGPTDVPTIGELLRLLGRRANLVLLPLGGSDAINAKAEPYLLEVRRLSDEVYAVIDSERTSESTGISKGRLGFQAACKNAGIRCHVLERRSIENYLSDEAVKGELGPSYGALAPYGSLKRAKPSWPKELNWRIASRMNATDVASTDLGRFLQEVTEPTSSI
jgi:putative AbiEii toxin of type IV toxin-antitoxin system